MRPAPPPPPRRRPQPRGLTCAPRRPALWSLPGRRQAGGAGPALRRHCGRSREPAPEGAAQVGRPGAGRGGLGPGRRRGLGSWHPGDPHGAPGWRQAGPLSFPLFPKSWNQGLLAVWGQWNLPQKAPEASPTDPDTWKASGVQRRPSPALPTHAAFHFVFYVSLSTLPLHLESSPGSCKSWCTLVACRVPSSRKSSLGSLSPLAWRCCSCSGAFPEFPGAGRPACAVIG